MLKDKDIPKRMSQIRNSKILANGASVGQIHVSIQQESIIMELIME